MKPKPITLENLIAKRAAAEADLAEINAAEPALIEQEERLTEQLSTASAAALLHEKVGDGGLDEKQDLALRTLKTVRIKKSIIPGLRVRAEADLAALDAEIDAALAQELRRARELARRRVDELEKETRTAMLSTAGGDDIRAKKATAAVVENSEAKRWFDEFRTYTGNTDSAAAAQLILRLIEGFKAGKTVNASR